MDKYRLEEWISVLSSLHSCLGLQREEASHPQCKEVLQALVEDIQEAIK